jgi:hypothetical protein
LHTADAKSQTRQTEKTGCAVEADVCRVCNGQVEYDGGKGILGKAIVVVLKYINLLLTLMNPSRSQRGRLPSAEPVLTDELFEQECQFNCFLYSCIVRQLAEEFSHAVQ